MPNASTVFVDTNVLLYAQDPRSPEKQRAASRWLQQCWQTDSGRISTQVLHEFYVNLRRLAPKLALREARAMVARYRLWRPLLVDEATVDLAWEIQDQHPLSYWDALMVAAARQQGCAVMLTEDLQHGLQLGGVRIVDPFREPPGAPA